MTSDRNITCSTCADSHEMWHQGLERYVLCTQCPTPCRECVSHGGRGAYCIKTPCPCKCHQKQRTIVSSRVDKERSANSVVVTVYEFSPEALDQMRIHTELPSPRKESIWKKLIRNLKNMI